MLLLYVLKKDAIFLRQIGFW